MAVTLVLPSVLGAIPLALAVLNMHRARHTFATDLRRVADLGATSQALGHSDLSSAAAIYGHHDLTDLERAMDALAKARRAEVEEPAH